MTDVRGDTRGFFLLRAPLSSSGGVVRGLAGRWSEGEGVRLLFVVVGGGGPLGVRAIRLIYGETHLQNVLANPPSAPPRAGLAT